MLCSHSTCTPGHLSETVQDEGRTYAPLINCIPTAIFCFLALTAMNTALQCFGLCKYFSHLPCLLKELRSYFVCKPHARPLWELYCFQFYYPRIYLSTSNMICTSAFWFGEVALLFWSWKCKENIHIHKNYSKFKITSYYIKVETPQTSNWSN